MHTSGAIYVGVPTSDPSAPPTWHVDELVSFGEGGAPPLRVRNGGGRRNEPPAEDVVSRDGVRSSLISLPAATDVPPPLFGASKLEVEFSWRRRKLGLRPASEFG